MKNCWTCSHRLEKWEGCRSAVRDHKDATQFWLNANVRMDVDGPRFDGFCWPPEDADGCPGYEPNKEAENATSV